jgi:hypothetical protein
VTLSSFLTTAVSPVTWLAVGMFLIGISLIAPNPLTAALGFAGLVTALVALSVPVLAKQLFIWGILSGAMVLIFFGLTPNGQRPPSHPPGPIFWSPFPQEVWVRSVATASNGMLAARLVM